MKIIIRWWEDCIMDLKYVLYPPYTTYLSQIIEVLLYVHIFKMRIITYYESSPTNTITIHMNLWKNKHCYIFTTIIGRIIYCDSLWNSYYLATPVAYNYLTMFVISKSCKNIYT